MQNHPIVANLLVCLVHLSSPCLATHYIHSFPRGPLVVRKLRSPGGTMSKREGEGGLMPRLCCIQSGRFCQGGTVQLED